MFSGKKKTVLLLRWLLILSSWAIFSYRPGMVGASYGHALFALFALSNLALMLVRPPHFNRPAFTFSLVVVDTVLASVLLYGKDITDYGTFVIFFIMILLAAAGQSFKLILTTGVTLAAGYVLLNVHLGSFDAFLRRPDALLKLPFLLVVSLFYGYFVEENRGLQETLARYSERVRHFGAEIQKTYWETLKSLMNALDLRDTGTRHHSLRVTAYTLTLCKALGIPEEQWPDIERGALLHDIGKIGISDTILLKKGPLTDEEWVIMRRHPMLGHQMVHGIPFLEGAADIILYHHERVDGKGYPFGLKGESIPLSARVFAVADTIDAITSGRPYKERQSLVEVSNVLLRNCGTQFERRAVEAYFSIPAERWERLQRDVEAQAALQAAESASTSAPQATRLAPPAAGERGAAGELSAQDLPRRSSQSLSAGEREHSGAPRILVVDDEEPVCTYLKYILEAKGYAVDTSQSAAEAIRQLSSRQYSVAILDYRMPMGDGKFLYQRLRDIDPDLSQRVLLITGAPFEEPLARFLAKNPIPLLRKPFEPEEVVSAVRHLQPPA